jgi:hypothetical protein
VLASSAQFQSVSVYLKTNFDRQKRIKRVQDQTDNLEFSGCCRAKAAVRRGFPVPALCAYPCLQLHADHPHPTLGAGPIVFFY